MAHRTRRFGGGLRGHRRDGQRGQYLGSHRVVSSAPYSVVPRETTRKKENKNKWNNRCWGFIISLSSFGSYGRIARLQWLPPGHPWTQPSVHIANAGRVSPSEPHQFWKVFVWRSRLDPSPRRKAAAASMGARGQDGWFAGKYLGTRLRAFSRPLFVVGPIRAEEYLIQEGKAGYVPLMSCLSSVVDYAGSKGPSFIIIFKLSQVFDMVSYLHEPERRLKPVKQKEAEGIIHTSCFRLSWLT